MSRPPGTPDAYAALRRGTGLVRANVVRGVGTPSPKVVGNLLAELDRLLHVLIGQAALDRGTALPARSRDTGVRLAALCGPHADAARLCALQRSTTCLRRHDGRAHHADRRGCGSMTVGWPGSSWPSQELRTVELGASVMPSAEQMHDVCAFYDRLARRIVGEHREIRATIQLHGPVRLAA